MIDPTVADMLDWHVDRKGNRTVPKSSQHNLRTAIENDPALADIWYNSFDGRVYLGDATLDDDTIYALWEPIERIYSFDFTRDTFRMALRALAKSRPHRNPLCDYLRGLRWDGVSRIDTVLMKAFGVADTPLDRAIGARWLIQAVGRALVPGVKADIVLVLCGAKGLKKSMFFRMIAGDRYFADTTLHVGHRSIAYQLNASWIHEVAEFYSFSRADINATKQFLSQQSDTFVPPYGKEAVTVLRRCIFGATSNNIDILTDVTGNRKFWPVTVTMVLNVAWLEANRDQLLAEAVVRFDRGDQYWFDEQSEVPAEIALHEAMEERSRVHTVERPWESAIQEWAARVSTVPAVNVETLLRDGFDIRQKDINGSLLSMVGRAFSALGWKSQVFHTAAGAKRFQVRPGVAAEEVKAWIKAGASFQDAVSASTDRL